MRPLVFSTLWPNAGQPHLGIFVKERLRLYSRRHRAPLCVVAPVPLAPPFGPQRWRVWRGVPGQEQQDDVRVTHPRYFSPPLLPDRVRAACLAAGSRQRLLDEALRFQPTVLDAHYAWPDGVAAHRLRPQLEAHLKRRLPLVITARGTDLNLAPSLPGVRAQLAAALAGADHVICVAEALRAVALELGVPAERATTLRNGVDLERFRPGDRAAERAALGLPAAGVLLLCVGHLIERKGQHLLLEALARRPPADGAAGSTQLALVGSGPDEARLRGRARRLGLAERVSFAGPVHPEALPRWYRAADALVLPSLREGWPNVVLEALACGTPVLATAVWGTPEILTGCAAAALVEPTVEGLAAG
ncbi:MAG TPA: glycosyltransferase, partial [Planctomycetota bacterium]|nr:glycosyltransferase [Planctomycetota bacterium]